MEHAIEILLLFDNNIDEAWQLWETTIMASTPSDETSLIDLDLISNPELLLDCFTVSPIEMMDVCSYHNCVRLTLRWKPKHYKQVQKQARTIWRYENADFQKANRMIEEVDR